MGRRVYGLGCSGVAAPDGPAAQSGPRERAVVRLAEAVQRPDQERLGVDRGRSSTGGSSGTASGRPPQHQPRAPPQPPPAPPQPPPAPPQPPQAPPQPLRSSSSISACSGSTDTGLRPRRPHKRANTCHLGRCSATSSSRSSISSTASGASTSSTSARALPARARDRLGLDDAHAQAPAVTTGSGGEDHLRPPPRRLEPHRAAGMFALPGNGCLRLEPGDLDLSKLAQVARQ